MTSWHLAASIDDIRAPLFEVREGLARFAIATLVEVDGSAPRDVGAQMLITGDQHWGFLSGGCIEDDVARHGREVLARGAPRLLRYGEGSPWIDIKLACGSAITMLVEPVGSGEPAVAALLDGWLARRTVLLSSDGVTRCAEVVGEAAPDSWDGTHYTRLFTPPLRLVLIGEDGGTLTAASLALAMGWQVALITPGGPEAAPLAGITYQRATRKRRLRPSLPTGGPPSPSSRTTARTTSAGLPRRCDRRRSMSARSGRGCGSTGASPSCAATALPRRRWRGSMPPSGSTASARPRAKWRCRWSPRWLRPSTR